MRTVASSEIEIAGTASLQGEARFRALADALPSLVFEADAEGRNTYVNKRYEDFTGLSFDALMGQGWVCAIHPEDKARVLEAAARSLRTGQAFNSEHRLRRSDGEWRWFIVRAVAVRDLSGRITRWVGTCTDIDDRRQATDVLNGDREVLARMVEARTAELMRAADERERAQEALRQGEKLQAIGELTGGVAHDFNNTLQIIASGLALLRTPTLTEERRTFLMDGMEQAVRNAAQLTSRLLTFARRQTLNPQTFELNDRVQNLAALLKASLGSTVSVHTRLSPEAMFVHVDPSQFETAVVNLSVNARDAMPAGGTITIDSGIRRRHFGHGEAEWAFLTLCDTGEGMTPQVKSRVFEPFFTTKPVGHGTGLGLAQVYGFVKQSGGDIEIESEIGKGTKVTLFLPLRSGEAAERDDPPPAHDAHLLRNKTILIVDDNAQVVEFIESMLGELGCRTVTAKGADAALSILKDTVEIDGVFSDVVMPGELDGIALLRTIRQTYPHLAVVLATGYSDRFLRDGVPPNCEILAKPFRLNEISSAMARALDACAPRR